ncbi:hypothetical protein AMTRI_Chr10g226800 [Amborella trichopoda]|uniref:DSBA-like thioredoxin domain-containing protein n=1 Tax=Amborella trichopoda TaxID=13333 RepID=U5CWV8_AMBTC|nr:uncharacterized protein LOC18446167 [Amborella trichopoda]ERN17821.1 hypothetical protein AMTR_s00047p00180410 [Amborella trichopoda]|eukprot:XP_006856354.1 uncharacterized protein LOC18446167 [Amborella trichopoda]
MSFSSQFPAPWLKCKEIFSIISILKYNKPLSIPAIRRNIVFMDQSLAQSSGKKHIRIDVSSDTVCPWCFVGKQNLNKAMDSTKDLYNFEVRWHPFLLEPNAPKEGIKVMDFYENKFGAEPWKQMRSRMSKVFQDLGFEYNTSGLTGSTLDSHRLIEFAGHQGVNKQNALVQELLLNYFCQGKYIGNRQVLLEAANKVGVEGARELLDDPNKCLEEVNEGLNKYSAAISGVPNFLINGKYRLNGGQPPQVFLRAFQAAAKENTL